MTPLKSPPEPASEISFHHGDQARTVLEAIKETPPSLNYPFCTLFSIKTCPCRPQKGLWIVQEVGTREASSIGCGPATPQSKEILLGNLNMKKAKQRLLDRARHRSTEMQDAVKLV